MSHLFKRESPSSALNSRSHSINVEIKINNDYADIDEVVEAFRQYLLSCGFHPDTVDEVLGPN